jgi:signal transduction histidine kinase
MRLRRRLWRIIHDRAGYSGLPLAFKGLMILGLAAIAAILTYTTQTMVAKLKASEARLANAYAGNWKRAAETSESGEVGFLFDQIISKGDFPIVVTDPDNQPLYWRSLPDLSDTDTSRVARGKVIDLMRRMGKEYPPVPIYYEGYHLNNLYYGNIALVDQVERLPYVGVAVMLLFLSVAYIGFRNIKRAEQRYIWVGMAKETAHQLGTPLMSLMGWLERLEGVSAEGESGILDRAKVHETLEYMRGDIVRLNRVAQRFSQIGSEPDRKLQPVDVVVREVVSYFRSRLPHSGRGVSLHDEYVSVPDVPINSELVAWVLENLIKNALDSVDPRTGRVEVSVAPHPESGVKVTVTDNGRGITPAQARKIFQAGFTTKKRGWGLGLTLARRIVMEYHNGDLYLDSSIPNLMTRFVVHLPAAKE